MPITVFTSTAIRATSPVSRNERNASLVRREAITAAGSQSSNCPINPMTGTRISSVNQTSTIAING
ncbi:MAG: hypothetical protein ABIA75_07900 [Candidatus Neomarinimicrobiota bacterium]